MLANVKMAVHEFKESESENELSLVKKWTALEQVNSSTENWTVLDEFYRPKQWNT